MMIIMTPSLPDRAESPLGQTMRTACHHGRQLRWRKARQRRRADRATDVGLKGAPLTALYSPAPNNWIMRPNEAYNRMLIRPLWATFVGILIVLLQARSVSDGSLYPDRPHSILFIICASPGGKLL